GARPPRRDTAGTAPDARRGESGARRWRIGRLTNAMTDHDLDSDDDQGFRHLGDTEVHRGHVWNVVVADFAAPDGSTFRRDIVRSPGSVGVVPIVFDAEGFPSVVLVRQYRPPYERAVTEIPAGMRDVPGEPAEDTGRRELIEEVGLRAGEMEH